MMTEYYRDPYGCTASIKSDINRDGYVLRVCDPYGSLIYKKKYDTRRGAKIALGKLGDGLMEQTRKEVF